MAATDYEILDERFRGCIAVSAQVERLSTGCRWCEGPVYFPAMRSLLWSDIPNDRMLRYDEASGAVSTYRQPSGYANGNTVDREGRLVTCEHGGRRVIRTEHDGAITVLAERYEGKRFNSPNDVVVRSDGSIWFTDPSYGIDSHYEGIKSDAEIDGCHVYRIDPHSRAIRRVADDFTRPNGLAFSVDESVLYIADTGLGDGTLRRFGVADDGRLSGGDVFLTETTGRFDGFRIDEADRVWTSAGPRVNCYEPDGTLIGKIVVPEGVSNVVFGGPKRNRLFITATSSLYAVLTRVAGAKTF